MFMFWSKRAVLTRRLLKAKVRGEHETECETQEDTFSRINSTITNNGTTQQQQQQRQQQLRQQQQQQIQQQQNTTSRGQSHRSSISSSTNRVNSVANRFHQGCCGGDLSHDEDDDTEKNSQHHQHHQQQQQQQSRVQPNRLTRCKDLLKTLKENQLEMLLNVVESYGSDFGSCVLVPRKQTSPGRSSPVESRRRSASPGLPKQQDSSMSQCNRHQRCGLASTLHENPTRRVSHRHLLRSRRHNPPGARCSRCVSSHTIGNEEQQQQQQQQQQRVTTGNTGCNRDEFPTSTNDDDFTVTENRDNEMNLRIVDTNKRSNTGQANDDPRQEQPAWSAGEESNATINGSNMPPVGSTCCNGQRLNEEGVSRPERDRCRRNHGGKMGRTTGRRRRDEANIGDNSSGSETSLDSPLDDPHLLSCQIWRWPDLANSSELKKLPVCHSAKDPVYVCCNPYHWSRLCKPESPPPPYCLIPDRLRPEDRAPSEISGDYRRCGITTSPQHHSLTTNGEGGAEMGQKEWCTLAYWELGGRVGRLYPVEPSTVNVFDSLHDGDGLCLATLAENHVASLAVQRTRSKIGLGLMLSQEPDGVWAYNRSESPIFVNSPTLDDPESRTLLVYRVPPGFCLNIFDRAKTYQLPRCHGQGSPTSGSFNSGPVDVNSVRISFAKGWGPKYSRQEVTSCPCWLEVLLAPCR